MTAYLCLLYAVNVGGRKVPSGELRTLVTELGFGGATTIANSGTLMVTEGTTGATSTSDVARILSDSITERYGFDVMVAAVTADHLERIAERNPFRVMADKDPAHLLVYVGQGHVDAAGIAELSLAHPGTEQLAVANSVLYVTYPRGVGTSTLTVARLGKAAGTPLTGRNWNSLTRARKIGQDLELASE